MTWKIRHEGSPRSIEGLTAPQVVEGLQDGLWEPTDEVMGPEDTEWTAIESHRDFAEAAADLEPPGAKLHEDETRLDMNPLIDVCLVLLIFFILTTSYAALQKVLDMPGMSAKNIKGAIRRTKEEVAKFTIKVEVREENGQPIYKVEDQPVEPDELTRALSRYVNQTHKTEVLLDAQGVTWGTVIAVQDAARGAAISKVNFLKH
jgi:biopolymer transport protein ExbD